MSLRENRLRTLWSEGRAAVNGWLAVANGFSAETMAHQGWDTLTIDLQHGVVDYQAMVTMLQAISTTPTVPLVRVPWLEPGILMKTLDAGAYGVICPMIDGVEDARRFASACRYPPLGNRSYGPTRGFLYGGPDYFSGANEEILTLAMIETPQGLRDVYQIAAIEGIDGLFVGPSDLSLALGLEPGVDWRSGSFANAIDHILAAARRHGKMTGIYCTSVPFALDMKQKGFDYLNLANDATYLRTAAQSWVGAMKGPEAGARAGSEAGGAGKATGY